MFFKISSFRQEVAIKLKGPEKNNLWKQLKAANGTEKNFFLLKKLVKLWLGFRLDLTKKSADPRSIKWTVVLLNSKYN